MKKIAVYCVNYNSYEFLDAFLLSVDKAAECVCDVSVSVFVADNTEQNFKTVSPIVSNIVLKVFTFHKNLGYFGAVSQMMVETPLSSFDYVIISNVDVKVDINAFAVLMEKQYCNNVGWIAPQIYSELEKRDRNPQVVARYSLRRLRILHFLFRHPYLLFLYKKTAYKRKRKRVHSQCCIYAGHGSFIILTNEYFNKCGIIDYPIFLFGEEIYLAEQCRNHGLSVVYDSAIKIIDVEHVSTSKMPYKSYCKSNAEALEYVIKNFYVENTNALKR